MVLNKRTSTKSGKKFHKKSKNRANKINLVFDEEKRREFLTGFRKRKLQRKQKAIDQLAEDLKTERKRLKAEAKESYKNLVVSHRPIPELEELLKDEYEDEEVNVRVVELSTNDIAERNNWIGANKPIYEVEEEEVVDDIEEEIEEMPGMELKRKPLKKVEKKKEVTPKPVFETGKDVKRTLKKQATKNVKKSKVFQMKNKMESQKQKKKSMKDRNERIKLQNKKKRVKKH